jgi:phage-related protein
MSDNSRVFRFGFVPAPNGDETITVDNKNQIITSSRGDDFSRIRFNNFNLNWARLVRGMNNLQITGNGVLKMTCSFPKRIGN